MSLSVSGSLEHGAILHERNLNVRPAATHVRIDRQDGADSNGTSDARSPLSRAESNGTAHLTDEAGFGVKGNAKGELQARPPAVAWLLRRLAWTRLVKHTTYTLACPPQVVHAFCLKTSSTSYFRCRSLCCGFKHPPLSSLFESNLCTLSNCAAPCSHMSQPVWGRGRVCYASCSQVLLPNSEPCQISFLCELSAVLCSICMVPNPPVMAVGHGRGAPAAAHDAGAGRVADAARAALHAQPRWTPGAAQHGAARVPGHGAVAHAARVPVRPALLKNSRTGETDMSRSCGLESAQAAACLVPMCVVVYTQSCIVEGKR